LAHINQFQMGGDWSKNTLDLEIDALLLIEPDGKLLAAREAYVRVQAEEAAAAVGAGFGESAAIIAGRFGYAHIIRYPLAAVCFGTCVWLASRARPLESPAGAALSSAAVPSPASSTARNGPLPS
jgi:hypothetical protein